MKTPIGLYCCAVLALPQVASAQTALPGDAMGQLAGIIEYCSRVNPGDAAKYQGLGLSFRQAGASTAQSTSYQEAYRTTGATLARTSKGDGLDACKGFVNAGIQSGGGGRGARH